MNVMAYVICQFHGGHGAPLVCEHLRNAMLDRLPLPRVVYVEAWYLDEPAWGEHLCPACALAIGATDNPTIWKDDGGLDRLIMGSQSVAPVCPRCFDDAKAI